MEDNVVKCRQYRLKIRDRLEFPSGFDVNHAGRKYIISRCVRVDEYSVVVSAFDVTDIPVAEMNSVRSFIIRTPHLDELFEFEWPLRADVIEVSEV